MGIFWTPDDSTKIEKVTMPWAAETYFIPEGTPMSATGIANNGDAIGITDIHFTEIYVGSDNTLNVSRSRKHI